MAVYFLESSALVKRYAVEDGTAWVRDLSEANAGNTFFIAQITGVEAVAAITLRARRGSMTAEEAGFAIAHFRQDFDRMLYTIPVVLTIIARAMDLAERHALRGYDAVQLASALQVQVERQAYGLSSPIFLSADNNLNAAAAAEGLAVDNPNSHP